jgi:hypothetical protein
MNRLAAWADVLMTNYPRNVRKGLGLDYKTLAPLNDRMEAVHRHADAPLPEGLALEGTLIDLSELREKARRRCWPSARRYSRFSDPPNDGSLAPPGVGG